MYIAILGRLPRVSLTELECRYGIGSVTPLDDIAALVDTNHIDIQQLGGSPKAGRLITKLDGGWQQISKAIADYYSNSWRDIDHKITLGLSAYGHKPASAKQLQALGLQLKKSRKNHPGSLRLIPNTDSALSTATSHHNKLGLSPNKIELLIVQSSDGTTYLAESTGSQNITALAARDQGRPKRDAFVGMLPPKLAQIIINLANRQNDQPATLLDPFCGTGVILQEAALQGLAVYGSDLSDKMIVYSEQNLAWLQNTHHLKANIRLEQGDAIDHTWQPPIDVVACESYLGQPFSAPPSPSKLAEVSRNCNYIIGGFLENIAKQIKPGTPLCVAVPAWRDKSGNFTHLPLTKDLPKLGYQSVKFKSINNQPLIYYRQDQIVARELLVLTKV